MSVVGLVRLCGLVAVISLISTAAFADWTAYAIDGRGAVGHGRGPNRISAKDFALGWCGRPNCRVIMVNASRCVALAESHHNGYWVGTGAAGSRSGAIGYAMQYCGDRAPISTCRLRHAYCQ